MERVLLQQLRTWQNKANRLPLILQGARQVGKTWLLKEFGRLFFDNVCYINFEQDTVAAGLFDSTLKPASIIEQLELYSGIDIAPSRTLIIFDEVQEAPRALTSLKYFAEEAPDYAICCAGSFFGVALHQGTSFPVGKVDFMRLEPMSFNEFLMASEESKYAAYIAKGAQEFGAHWERLTGLLKQYMIVGGMPAAVSAWIETRNFAAVDEVQQRILLSFSNDFSKHVPDSLEAKIRHIWQSIPAQLARENKKFVYGIVRKGARAREYEDALLWMSDAGVIRRTFCVGKPDLPLSAYADFSAFKVFLLDVGLLRAMARLAPATILQGNSIFEEFKGALTEQFALQELSNLQDIEAGYYWTSAKAEVDFLFSSGSEVYPLEVKADINTHAKSLPSYIKKYSPAKAFRASLSQPRDNKGLIDFPLFAFSALPALLVR